MRTRYVLVGIAVLVALGAWGLVTLSGGGASTPVYDREAIRDSKVVRGCLREA